MIQRAAVCLLDQVTQAMEVLGTEITTVMAFAAKDYLIYGQKVLTRESFYSLHSQMLWGKAR